MCVCRCMVVFSTHDWSTRCSSPWIVHHIARHQHGWTIVMLHTRSKSVVRLFFHHRSSLRTLGQTVWPPPPKGDSNVHPPDQKTSGLALTPFMRVSWIPSRRTQSKWLGCRPEVDQTQVATAPQAHISPPQPTIHGLTVSMCARRAGGLRLESPLGSLFQQFKTKLSFARVVIQFGRTVWTPFSVLHWLKI